MPVAEDRLYNALHLNRWFAISSVLMTVSIVWMIYVDYDRPWRGMQESYFTAKAALAHLDYLDAMREDRQQEIATARQRVADAKQLTEQTAGVRRADLATKLADADLKFRKVDGRFGRLAQVVDVTKDSYERALAAHGAHHSDTERAHAALRAQEEELEGLRGDKERWEDETARLERLVHAIDDRVRVAEKHVEDLEDQQKTALETDQKYRGVLTDKGILGGLPIVKAIIHAPLLDFAAPMTTLGRQQVKQLVLPGIRQRLNYLESYTTDRCTTCHIAIDDPDFSRAELAKKLERALPGINEALGRRGLTPFEIPLPPRADNGKAIPAGKVTAHWNELNGEVQDAYFGALLDFVNRYMRLTGRKPIELAQPILAHPDLSLYVSVDSPHSMAGVGCTVCHEGNPQETDFVQAAHTPPTHQKHDEWKDQYYVTALGVPNVTFETIEHYWDRPMHLPQHTESGCVKCHDRIADIDRFEGDRKGERINLGQHLFLQVGCINCHKVEGLEDSRRVGPDLRHIGSKLQAKFVQQWIWFPQKFKPSTRMPHFFLQENNRAESENQFDTDPVYRTETEVAAMTHYLFAVSRDWHPIEMPEEVTGDADRGRTLFKDVGCLGCHANLAEFGEQWIKADLQHRKQLDEETAFHRYKAMTYEQRVHYAMEHFSSDVDTFLDSDNARFDPDKPYSKPVFTRFAPELSGIGSKVTSEWLYSWLMEPTHYAPDTKMPRLRLLPGEAADLAAYLMTLTQDSFVQREFSSDEKRQQMVEESMFILLSAQRSERRSRSIIQDEGTELTKMIVSVIEDSLGHQEAYDLVSAMTLEDKQLMYLGNKMIAHYGCYTCHHVPGFEETTPVGTELSKWAEKPVSQLDFAFYDHAFHDLREEREETFGYVYPKDAAELNHYSPAEDDLHEQITHTHAAFAKHKMLNPRIWDREKIKRPYDKLKMPNFYFTQTEATALTTYLLSRIPPRVNDSFRVDYERSTSGPIAEGRKLTRELNCIGCHQFEDNAPTVQHYYRREVGGALSFDELNAPPRLWGQGAKTQPDWMHRFFGNVETLRPWLQIRMPSFNLTTEQTTTLVAYFAALSQRDAQKLAEAHAPIEAYMKDEAERAQREGSATDETVGANWYRQNLLTSKAEELGRFVIDRKLMRPRDLDALSRTEDEITAAHGKMLKRTEFMKRLYDIEYPFGEPPLTLSPDERFARSERFFNDMGCLKCHVFGDMLPGPAKNTDDFVQMYRLDAVRGEGDAAIAILNGEPYRVGAVIDGHKLISAQNFVYKDSGDVETTAVIEGPNPQGETERVQLLAASAPNLGLTYKRLRRDWVYAWMLEPQMIQPGTKMPQNFPGGESPFAGDPDYPGSGEDHINLLVDYLYEGGTKRVRGPLLKVVLSEEDDEFDEDDDSFDEDEFD